MNEGNKRIVAAGHQIRLSRTHNFCVSFPQRCEEFRLPLLQRPVPECCVANLLGGKINLVTKGIFFRRLVSSIKGSCRITLQLFGFMLFRGERPKRVALFRGKFGTSSLQHQLCVNNSPPPPVTYYASSFCAERQEVKIPRSFQDGHKFGVTVSASQLLGGAIDQYCSTLKSAMRRELTSTRKNYIKVLTTPRIVTIL